MSQNWSRNLCAKLRREYILQLRLTGASFRQIAEQVRLKAKKEGWHLPKGYDERQACQDLRRYQQRRAREYEGEVRLQRDLAVERLGRLLMAIWPKALRGNRQDVAEAARLVGMIADLYGVKVLAKQAVEKGSPADDGEVLGKMEEGKLLRLVKDVFGRRDSG